MPHLKEKQELAHALNAQCIAMQTVHFSPLGFKTRQCVALHRLHLAAQLLLTALQCNHKDCSAMRRAACHLYLCICICVFVYLCFCVFACQTLGNIVFDVLVQFPMKKYSTCWVYLQI